MNAVVFYIQKPGNILSIAFLLLLCRQSSYAQIYPAGITTVLQAPHSIFISDYVDPFDPGIKATVIFSDFTEPNWNIALRLSVQGPGISLKTKPNFIPDVPIAVTPGVPYFIAGADLAPYFNYDNLVFNGITRSQIEVNNRLPEGFYTFCFEVIDFITGKTLSLPSCASAYLSLNDPPLIMAPACAGVIENIAQQNILFSWQLNNTNGNMNFTNINYQIDLYEVTNSMANPSTAILNNQALLIWQSPLITQNNFLYGITEPPLEKGKRYVFTVRVIEVDGKSQVKNNGYSQPCWFHYGYPEGGVIELVEPVDHFQFSLSSDPLLKWKRPSNTSEGQLVRYEINFTELQPGQDPDNAIIQNAPLYHYTTQSSTKDDSQALLPSNIASQIKSMQAYVWQVKGFSGEQQIAQSSAYTVTGPPVLDKFFAAGFEIKIARLISFDSLSNVCSGDGKVMINAANESVEFSFSNIKLQPLGNNRWSMVDGSIADKITASPFTLLPDTSKPCTAYNPPASFNPDSILIFPNKLQLGGSINWNLPLATQSQEPGKVKSQSCRLNLSTEFLLNNEQPITLSKASEFDLLEPFGFTLKLSPATSLGVNNSRYLFDFSGFVELPEKIKDGLNTSTNIPFANIHQLFYIAQQNTENSEVLKLIPSTKIDLQPIDYVIDFSDHTSPGGFANDSLWKGLYVHKARLQMSSLADQGGQISFIKDVAKNLALDDPGNAFAYITNKGLYLKIKTSFLEADELNFNTFHSTKAELQLSINESNLTNASLKGAIKIPVLDTAKTFDYLIPINEYGLQQGYLIQGLANYNFAFNTEGGDQQKINITVKKAVFRNNNHLEMDLDVHWPYFNLKLTAVPRFCVWGNTNIGFDIPNGTATLPYQATGTAAGFNITVDKIGCGRQQNLYAFGASAKIMMAEDISGEAGAPVVNVYSIVKNPLIKEIFAYTPATSGQSTTASTATAANTYTSNTDAYKKELAGNLNETMGLLGASKLNANLSVSDSSGNTTTSKKFVSQSTYIKLYQIVEIAEKLAPFVDSLHQEALSDLISSAKKILEKNSEYATIERDGGSFINSLLTKVAEALVDKINEKIKAASEQANDKVRQQITVKVVAPANKYVDSLLTLIVDQLKQNINISVGEQYQLAVEFVLNTTRFNVSAAIQQSISKSVELNVTSKVTGFIQQGLVAQVTKFVDDQIAKAAQEIVIKGLQANINLNSMLQNTGQLAKNLGDTVADALVKFNLPNIKNTVFSIANDAVSNINWDIICQQILNDLLKQGVEQGVVNGIKTSLGESAGDITQGVLGTVKFDFSNIGQKLKDGKLDKIVKFDYTTIYIVTNAMNVKGQLKFVNNDPVWGNSWQAMVGITLKVPDKYNHKEIQAFFVNGKASQGFSYWFVDMKAKGLKLPVATLPVTWDGVEGLAFHHMRKTGHSTAVPDAANKYGLGTRFYFYDTPGNGKTLIFDVGLDAVINSGNFAIELNGTANLGNVIKSGTPGVSGLPPIATGTGYVGYYSAEKKLAGKFNLKFNTQPLLCAGGEMGLNIEGKDQWKVYAGTRQKPLNVKVLCKDWLSAWMYLDIRNDGVASGLGLNVNIEAKSPWLKLGVIETRGFANLGFGFEALTDISWDPQFAIKEAYVHAWANAAVGVDYKTAATNGTLTIAGVSLEGDLLYRSVPKSELHGSMKGTVTILNYDIALNLKTDYDLENKKMME